MLLRSSSSSSACGRGILETDIFLQAGKASSGGNIHLSGGASLAMLDGAVVRLGQADFDGGGIYATSGATVTVGGSATETASIRGNTAERLGGGLYLTGSTTTGQILSAEVVDTAGWEGGGSFFVTSNATLLMERDLPNCNRDIRCSLLEGNSTFDLSGIETEGGAIKVTGGGTAQIRQTYITDSFAADAGKVALVEGTGSFLLLEGDVLFDNARTGPHVLARDGGHARLAFCSIWGSSTSGFGMNLLEAAANGRVDLYSSLVVVTVAEEAHSTTVMWPSCIRAGWRAAS